MLRDVVAGFLDTVTEREFDAPLIALPFALPARQSACSSDLLTKRDAAWSAA